MAVQNSNVKWWLVGTLSVLALSVAGFIIYKNSHKDKSNPQGSENGESSTNNSELNQGSSQIKDLKEEAWKFIENLVKQSGFDSFEWMNPEKTKVKFRVLDIEWDTDDYYAEMTKDGGIDFFEEGVFYETDGTRKNGYWTYQEQNGQKQFCINMKSQLGNGCWQDFRGIVNAVLKANYPNIAKEIK